MMRNNLFLALIFFGLMPPVWAHPGELDLCAGHVVEEYTEYAPIPDGSVPVPSEVGEYHFHFTKEQLENEVFMSLKDYRQTHPDLNPPDYGSFIVDGITYDILEYTRQQEAIIRCTEPNGDEHIGIVRGRVGW